MNNDLNRAQAAVQAHREKHPALHTEWRKNVLANLTLTEQRVLNMTRTQGTSWGWNIADIPRDVKRDTLRALHQKQLVETYRIRDGKGWVTAYREVAQ